MLHDSQHLLDQRLSLRAELNEGLSPHDIDLLQFHTKILVAFVNDVARVLVTPRTCPGGHGKKMP